MKAKELWKQKFGAYNKGVDSITAIKFAEEYAAMIFSEKVEETYNAQPVEKGQTVSETKAIQKQDDKYHLACQNCGTTSQPLQMIPFRNDDNVVGLLTCCDECKDDLYGQRFDRQEKFTLSQITEEEILNKLIEFSGDQNVIFYGDFSELAKVIDELINR